MEIVFIIINVIISIIAFFIIIIILGIILGLIYDLLVSSITYVIKRPFERKANKIKNKYPLAYYDFLDKNHISHSSDKFSDMLKISRCPLDIWNEEEKKLQEQERKRREIDIQYKEIEKSFSEGLKKWRRLNPNTTKEIVISNKYKIKDYDTFIKIAQGFNAWEEEQNEFTKKCRNLVDTMLPDFGCYNYQVPFKKTNDEGKSIDGNYKVWQSFAGSYCLETDLDYTDFKGVKENTNNLNEFKNRSRYYLASVYDKIRHFIEQLSNDYPISIYLCTNNQSWSAESLHYHYCECDGAPFYDLPDNVEVCDPVTDARFDDTEIDYDNYPKLKNRHIIIVEMQTNNEHLKMVCKNIIEKNKENKPLITYISFLKGYDRKEMEKLIDDERTKKKEEEKKKAQEKENHVVSICTQYGITGLYHMTHINNLKSILHYGLLSHSRARNGNYMITDIANTNVNDKRAHSEPIYNKPIHDYVPLYFNPKNPMLYVQDKQESIVILEISPKVFLKEGVIFSDGNAAVHTTATYNYITKFYSDLEDLDKLDWNCINDDYWNDYKDGKRKKCAEVLVPDVIEVYYIVGIHYLCKPTINTNGIPLKYSPDLYFN